MTAHLDAPNMFGHHHRFNHSIKQLSKSIEKYFEKHSNVSQALIDGSGSLDEQGYIDGDDHCLRECGGHCTFHLVHPVGVRKLPALTQLHLQNDICMFAWDVLFGAKHRCTWIQRCQYLCQSPSPSLNIVNPCGNTEITVQARQRHLHARELSICFEFWHLTLCLTKDMQKNAHRKWAHATQFSVGHCVCLSVCLSACIMSKGRQIVSIWWGLWSIDGNCVCVFITLKASSTNWHTTRRLPAFSCGCQSWRFFDLLRAKRRRRRRRKRHMSRTLNLL